MNTTMKTTLALMAGAMAFAACSSDDIIENIENNEVTEAPSQLKPMTFTAIQEGQGATRTAIDGLNVNWTAGDKISIFDGAAQNGGIQMFTIENGAGTTSATFTGSAAEASTYYALYPYAVGETSQTVSRDEAVAAIIASGQDPIDFDGLEFAWSICENDNEREEAINNSGYTFSEESLAIILAYLNHETTVTPGIKIEGSSIKDVVIPAEQRVTDGQTVDPQAMIMVAKGEGANTLQFKNVCAYVKVTPQFDCYAIGIISKGTQELAGTVTVNYNDGDPTTNVTADGTNEVYLLGDIRADQAYYIAVRPEALTSGFTIEFLTAGEKKYYTRSTSKELDLARNNVKNLGEFATTDTSWDYADLATSGNDGAGHNWVLMNPTFKALSPASWEEVSYASISTPWDGWELPGADELLSFINTVNITFDISSWTTSVESKGVLKYVCSHKLNGALIEYWTSDPDPTYGSDHVRNAQSTVQLDTNTWVWGISWLNRNLTTATYTYKYVN